MSYTDNAFFGVIFVMYDTLGIIWKGTLSHVHSTRTAVIHVSVYK